MPEMIVELNAAMTRSAALNSGKFRSEESNIGVSTIYGDHKPKETNLEGLREIIKKAESEPSISRQAAMLFVLLAKAQPFEESNKRTALFAANILLKEEATLTVPYDEYNKSISERFSELLARAYIFNEVDNCVDDLVIHGFKTIS